MDVQCELLETVRILMDESGLALADMARLTGLDKHVLLRLRKNAKAPITAHVETVIDKLGYEIVVRRKKK